MVDAGRGRGWLDDPELGRVRALVMEHGWNATAYQLINPGISRWFSERGDAVVGYVARSGVRVVAGAPVCVRERLGEVVAEFTASSRVAGQRVCFFAAGERLESLLDAQGGWSVASLGAQPSWDPRVWPSIIQRRASIRAQLHRARNKQVVVSRWPAERAQDHPALRGVLDEWLADRPLPPLHFLVESRTLSRLEDRVVLVAERAGVPVAFLVASPVPARRGWLIEQIVRGRRAVRPNSSSTARCARSPTLAPNT